MQIHRPTSDADGHMIERLEQRADELADALRPFAEIPSVEEGDVFNMEQVEHARVLLKAWDER